MPALAALQFMIAVLAASAQSDQGRPAPAVIEVRIRKADANGLKAIEAELRSLPSEACEPASRIRFSGLIAERYVALSMPKLALAHYHRAIAIPHSKQRRAADECAEEWYRAMFLLLIEYHDGVRQGL
jgi:hypothetical protein